MQQYNLRQLVPPNLYSKFWRETHPLGYIAGIQEEYYEKLNESEVIIWKNPTLNRREFHSNGEYKRDKDGNYITKEVALPTDCVAVLSSVQICVPYSFKVKDKTKHFEYVDCITQNRCGKELKLYVYLIPKCYVYVMNQTALVISSYRLGNYYSGVRMTLTNGQPLFLFIVKYKPSNQMRNNALVLHTKTDIDFSKEIEALKNEWLTHGIIFPPYICDIPNCTKGVTSVAYEALIGSGDLYERYDLTKPMSDTAETLEDINAEWNENKDISNQK